MTDFEIGWTAGILDGEGYIAVVQDQRHYRKPVVQVDNTDHKMVLRLFDLWGGNVHTRPKTKTGKEVLRWALHKRSEVMTVLRTVVPHLITKAEAARAVLTFCAKEG